MIDLLVFDVRKIPIEHRYTVLSAQGIFNKHIDETGEGVYCIWEHGREFFYRKKVSYTPETKLWLDIYEKRGLVKKTGVLSDIRMLFKLVRKYCDGYVVFDPEFIHSVNVATTIAGTQNAIIVHPKAEGVVSRLGFKKIMDLRDVNKKEWGNDTTKCYEWQYDQLFDSCNKNQIAFNGGFRFEIDYAISNEMCSVAIDPQKQEDLLLKYYKGIKYYGLNMGYPWTTKLERPMVECASKAGLRTGLMPSLRGAPFALNYSVHSRLPRAESYHQDNLVEVEYSDDKIYLGFGLSDLGFGMLQGFYYDQWYDPFRTDEKRTVKLSWWMDALTMDISPQISKYYYDTKHPTLDLFYSAHVYGRIRPSDFPNLADYLERGKGKLKEMDLEVVAFSNHHKWDNNVFREYSDHLKDTVKGFIYGFGPEFGDKQCMVWNGMPWVFTTFLHHGEPSTARTVYDYIKKHSTPQFILYGCAFGYQIPYAKVVQELQYIYNYLKEKLGNKLVNVNAVELVEMAKHCPSAVFSIDPLWIVGGVVAVVTVATAVYLLSKR